MFPPFYHGWSREVFFFFEFRCLVVLNESDDVSVMREGEKDGRLGMFEVDMICFLMLEDEGEGG